MDADIIHPKNILSVEDDPRDVGLTLAALETHYPAHRVAAVDDGAEALDFLYHGGKRKTPKGGHPILAPLDLKLHKVRGREVLKISRADENLKTIPVVVLSYPREKEDLIQCYQHGVNAYVVRPVDFAQFMEAVKQLIVFWAVVNEPPIPATREAASGRNGEVVSHGKNHAKNEIPTPHAALGG